MASHAPLVLVVDDAEDARDILAGTLEFAGYRVEIAQDGEEAIRRTRVLHPDAILLDLSMPKIDGFEVARRLKTSIRSKDVPIIAVSAYGMPDWELRAARAGCEAFLQKPVHPEELLGALRRALEAGQPPAG